MENQYFQVTGTVTAQEDKSTQKYTLCLVTMDNHFQMAAFGHAGQALLKQNLVNRRCCATVEASKAEKYTNYNVVHIAEIL